MVRWLKFYAQNICLTGPMRLLQGEGVSDTDIHTQIAQELKSHFNRKPRPSVSSAGIRLVAVSSLFLVFLETIENRREKEIQRKYL